ncbi:MAG: RlmE family RNA methyltransferase [Candidatus Bathyarchaeota archaeon]|nr:RlmE family RNA methyltransferase [Candidatus Bathyarchaeum tardum]WNZ29743.1 MAG: RlmE family RNA methyltransferase [Candidatus Bathyarchaeota archaeon]
MPGSAWVNERKNEFYYRKAKAENLRSRAYFKLIQAVQRYNFIKPGHVVVDLGAAPGGWTQAALRLVEGSGFVLAVDLKKIAPFDAPNALAIVGDVTQQEIMQKILQLLPHAPDVVVSDVAPNVSGTWELDHARQIDLATQSLNIAVSLLRPGGNFFVKVFQGSTTNNFIKDIKRHFSFVKLIKPKASRSKSAELYVLGMKFRK